MLFSMVTAVLNLVSMGDDRLDGAVAAAGLRAAAADGHRRLGCVGPGAGLGAVQRACAWRWRRSPGARRKGNTT